ncbi:hypothetical protein [Spirosoma pollinicola]|uniref:Uncharacterized protein n=1 Tax=Spirosoma pollinicola TaxID=2057025 RepID=A0A2K8YTD5_9BACT|nr:hypothetical protein [Spirosoma pollinicola]AUD00877.1 hypothetical protein CWM47_03030 [Spirosoma pollinicola]
MNISKSICIPINLDLKELILQNPPRFSYSIDTFKYIIDLILELPSWNNELFETNEIPYVPIHAITLQKTVWNYDEYFRYLLNTGILECDNYYLPKVKSKGYRLTSVYRTKLKEERITAPKLLSRIKQITKQRNANAFELYPNLTGWFEGLEINATAAVQYLEGLYIQDVESDRGSTEMANIRYAARNSMVSRISNKNFLYAVDNCGHRFHTCLTNLKSELRSYLSYKGHPLVSIDISNSQPYLAGSLLNHHFYEPVADDCRINLFNLPSNLIKEINPLIRIIKQFNLSSSFTSLCSGGGPFPMLVKSTDDKQIPDILLYLDLVQSGKFYEYMQELTKRSQSQDKSKLSRKEIKEMCMTVFFANPNDQNKYFKLQRDSFSSLFPTVYNIFNIIKSRQYNTLAILLQSIESELVLNKICTRITNERPDLPIFTIHDSICTTIGNEGYIEAIMNEELYNAVGMKPHFKKEYWVNNIIS